MTARDGGAGNGGAAGVDRGRPAGSEVVEAAKVRITSENGRRRVLVCAGTACVFAGSLEVSEAFKSELAAAGLTDIGVSIIGCHGLCSASPVTVVSPDDTLYPNLKPKQVKLVVEQHLRDGRAVEKLLPKDPATGERVADYHELGFYRQQTRIALRNVGRIDPEDIEACLARGGYDAARDVLSSRTPEEVIDEIVKSGLRGRGGAGFSTGMKWKFAHNSQDDVKYLICNADEGDPGAFMDCSIMEGDPHSVIEGMIIGSYAIGAHHGYVYIRAEYPIAVRRLRKAMADAEERGLLGSDIMGTGWDFHLKVKEGAGAFVCGEETAMIASIEGRRGMPRTRPPYPAVSGLFGKPTNINNVETWANVPWIMANGGAAYAVHGSETSKGTKAFSLAGKIVNGGLVEVPMGSTLRHIIFDVGGGVKGGREFKAVQLGGPSGGCLPASHLDTPIDYESLAATGAILGSGGMVVVDDRTCMVDLARYFLEFTQKESCGKCVPCRIGTKRMLETLERICAGEGQAGDIERLERLAGVVKRSSLCALGGTAPNPVLTTLRFFREEYTAHVEEGRCPAGSCSALISYYIDADACTGCALCAKKCPVQCIAGERKQTHVIDTSLCIKCDTCRQVCTFDAVGVHSPAATTPAPARR